MLDHTSALEIKTGGEKISKEKYYNSIEFNN